MLLMLCLAALIAPASAQHFKQVVGFTGSMQQVAAGRNEVWGINTSGQVFRFVGSKFVAIPGTLSQIAVGGGTLRQKDEIWGLDSSGNVFHFNYGTKSFTHLTGSLTQITVGEGDIDFCHPYEVWGINSNHSIFRYNYCTKQFDSISGSLMQVATSGGAVWGNCPFCNGPEDVYAFNFASQTFQDTGIGGFVFLTVGATNPWFLDAFGNIWMVFVNGANYGIMSFPGNLSQIAAGGDGVWGINSNQNIYRLDPDTGTFLNVPGFFSQIAVGSGAGVWGVSPNSGDVFTFVRP